MPFDGKVLVTGGAGYVGCALVPRLLAAGHRVVVYDIMYFGDRGLQEHPRLEVVRGDIRDTARFASALAGVAQVIHLACISNDPSFELDPSLGKSINYDCFEPLVLAARDAGVRRFIYASSSSVYGVSRCPDVTEDHPLNPLTDYSRFKALCEDILRRLQSSGFSAVIIRPATVCGYSPRMRFDLSVNILANLAVNERRITVFGGEQKRPNLHIEDMAELYTRLLELPDASIAGETFNAGYQNHTLAELAERVRRVVETEMPQKAPVGIATSPTDDLRSYHISSGRIAAKLGFVPRRAVEDAVRDLCRAFEAGKLPDSLTDIRYYNVKTMKALTSAPGS
jgi:nucleoside-diphosphate-sugar epimerase